MIAALEFAKGLLVLLAVIGFLYFRRHDLQQLLLGFVKHLNLDPASRIPYYAHQLALRAQSMDGRFIAVLGVAYASVRFAEAWGLWFDRTWGTWLGALSGGIYLPFEIYDFCLHPAWPRAMLILGTTAIVAFLAYHLYKRERAAASRAPCQTEGKSN